MSFLLAFWLTLLDVNLHASDATLKTVIEVLVIIVLVIIIVSWAWGRWRP